MTDRPAPLVPQECDLQDFPFMPLQVSRLRDSDMLTEENPEACWYAVLLWAASWHQIPAGSLPDNDAILTRLVGLGRDLKTFKKHRSGAMRGFILCDDGRFYHPVIAEQAKNAWAGKLRQRWATECARIKKHNQRKGTSIEYPSLEAFVSKGCFPIELSTVPDGVPGIAPHGVPIHQDAMSPPKKAPVPRETASKGEGEGEYISSAIAEGGKPPGADLFTGPGGPVDEPPATGKMVWDEGLELLRGRGQMPEAKARRMIGLWVKNHGQGAALEAIRAADAAGTADPVPYVEAAIARIALEQSNPLLAPDPQRQRVWMRDWKAQPGQWRDHERGPKPGQPGCRVSAAVQAEFDNQP